jgi:hypothetical protein
MLTTNFKKVGKYNYPVLQPTDTLYYYGIFDNVPPSAVLVGKLWLVDERSYKNRKLAHHEYIQIASKKARENGANLIRLVGYLPGSSLGSARCGIEMYYVPDKRVIDETKVEELFFDNADSLIVRKRNEIAGILSKGRLDELPEIPVIFKYTHVLTLKEQELIHFLKGNYTAVFKILRDNAVHGWLHYDYDLIEDRPNAYPNMIINYNFSDSLTNALGRYFIWHADSILDIINGTSLTHEEKAFLKFYIWFTAYAYQPCDIALREKSYEVALQVYPDIVDKKLRQIVKIHAHTGERYKGMQISLTGSFIHEIPIYSENIRLASAFAKFNSGYGIAYRNLGIELGFFLGRMKVGNEFWSGVNIPSGKKLFTTVLDLQLFYELNVNQRFSLAPMLGFQSAYIAYNDTQRDPEPPDFIPFASRHFSYGIRMSIHAQRWAACPAHTRFYQQSSFAWIFNATVVNRWFNTGDFAIGLQVSAGWRFLFPAGRKESALTKTQFDDRY